MKAAFSIVMVFAVASVVWGVVLDIRYTGPYTLLCSTSAQKWKRSATVVFFYTVWFPLLVSLSSDPPVRSAADYFQNLLFSVGILARFYVLGVCLKRWMLERDLKHYKSLNGMLASNHWIIDWMRAFGRLLGDERRRFYREGYPSDVSKAPLDIDAG